MAISRQERAERKRQAVGSFYVNSRGFCPAFSTEPFVPPDAPKPSPYKQPELF